jgi:hypothetical protein
VNTNTDSSSIRRFSDERRSWRVVVETWRERDGYHGRLVFTQDHARGEPDRLEGPPALYGSTREDVVAEAFTYPEQRLRQVFRSLA